MIGPSLRSTLPLAAIAIFLAEYLLDKTEPRYESPWWWLSLIGILTALLVSQAVRARSFRKTSTPDERRSRGLVRGSNDVRDLGGPRE